MAERERNLEEHLEEEEEEIDEEEMDRAEDDCPNCGMARSEWKGNSGKGYTKDGETYCCRGCAEGTGCTCM